MPENKEKVEESELETSSTETESSEKEEKQQNNKEQTDPIDPIALAFSIISVLTLSCTAILFLLLNKMISDKREATLLYSQLTNFKGEKWQTLTHKMAKIKNLKINLNELPTNIQDTDISFLNVSPTVYFVIFDNKLLFRVTLKEILKKFSSVIDIKDKKVINPLLSYCFLCFMSKMDTFLLQIRENKVYINKKYVSERSIGLAESFVDLLKK